MTESTDDGAALDIVARCRLLIPSIGYLSSLAQLLVSSPDYASPYGKLHWHWSCPKSAGFPFLGRLNLPEDVLR